MASNVFEALVGGGVLGATMRAMLRIDKEEDRVYRDDILRSIVGDAAAAPGSGGFVAEELGVEAGAYTRPLLSSTWPFVTQEHTLTTPYYPLTPPTRPPNTP